MDSSYFGDPNMGSGSGSGSSSSRKGKKGNSDKPKQPQRGLGVAQLEKIRLQGQMGYAFHSTFQSPYATPFNSEEMRVQTAYSPVPSSSFSYSSSSAGTYSFQPNITMGLGDYERANIGYGDSSARWDPNNRISEHQHFAETGMTRHLLAPQEYHTRPRNRRNEGENSQNSESSDTQDIDLELRL